jgi:hypothetical protein
MKNIYLIPTDKPSKLQKTKHDNFFLSFRVDLFTDCTSQHIYITSDEEIKGFDWCYDKVLNIVFQTDNHTNFNYVNQTDNVFKIILTTDQDLIKDGVQAIDDTFLEWFVKNPSCEYVETDLVPVNEFGSEITVNSYGFDKFKYKIIIPKEEPKLDLEKEMFELEQELDIPSHLRWYNSKPKQETLEEAAERIVKNKVGLHYFGNETSLENLAKKQYVVEGAKWQQEQDKNKFSEEEVIKAYHDAYHKGYRVGQKDAESHTLALTIANNIHIDRNKWFEQFKKK